MYPNNYFAPRQWFRPLENTLLPEGNPPYGTLGRYGVATRGQAMIQTPAVAAFSAVAPFDFFTLRDSSGPEWTFVFRPDLAPAGPSVADLFSPRTVVIRIQGRTDTQVAQDTVDAIALVSSYDGANFPWARLGIVARLHGGPINQLTLTAVRAGYQTARLDVTGITAVAGFASRDFSVGPGVGSMIVGPTPATGYIVAVTGAALVDGETFTIDDGVVTQVFEFDDDAAVTPGNTAVPFTAGDTAATVAASIAAAINSPAAPPVGRGPTWDTLATVDDTVVRLRHRTPGAFGGSLASPLLMVEDVANAAFVVVGMTGGQDGSIGVPLRWGLSRGAAPIDIGFERDTGEE